MQRIKDFANRSTSWYKLFILT